MQNYDNSSPAKNTAELREAQYLIESLPNTEVAVTIDAGDQWGIHPSNKQAVGARLALLALKNDNGLVDLEYNGPRYQTFSYDNNKAIVSFKNTFGGLQLPALGTVGFELAGADGIFYNADNIEVDANTLSLSASQVTMPVKVRYGWTNWVSNYLYNSANLPSSSFRTYNALPYSVAYVVNHANKSINDIGSTTSVADFLLNITLYDNASVKLFDAANNEKTTGSILESDYLVVSSLHNYEVNTYALNFDNVPTNVDSETADVVLIYPNPTSDFIYIKKSLIGSLIEIYNTAGVIELQHEAKAEHVKLDVNHFTPGIYFIKSSDNKTMAKFIKN